MVIPYIAGFAVIVLGLRWMFIYRANRLRDRDMERRIRNRQDLHRL